MSIDYSLFKYSKNKRIEDTKLLKDKKGICSICGKKTQTDKHHKKSKGSGGNDTKENLIELCRICHTKVHAGNIKLKGVK